MENTKLIKLNQWILDPLENCLIKEDNTSIPLEAKYVELLVFLADNIPQIISREQLMQEVWNNRFVEYTTINAAISRLRKTLGGERDAFIKTHLKRGYSLTCRVEYLDRSKLVTTNVQLSSDINHVQSAEETRQEGGEKRRTEAHINIQENEIASAKVHREEITPLTAGSTGKQPAKILSAKPFYKLYSLLATLILVIVLWQLTQPTTSTPQILTKHEAPEEPLTYLEGWEYAPALSPDKTLLAFTHKANNTSKPRVIIQSIKTKQNIALEPESITPYWSPLGDELFYMSVSQDNCTIKKVTVKQTLEISSPIEVIQCAPYVAYASNTGIAVSPDSNWLYYTSTDNQTQPSSIKRYHLKSHYSEAITAPPGKYEGDASLRLSPDGSKLAFKRYSDNYSESIMVLNLNSGETSSLINKSTLANEIAWSPSGSHVLYLDEKEKTLNAINISTGDNTALYQYDSDAEYPLMYSENEILLTLGFSSNVSINRLDLDNQKLISPLISSSFRDRSAGLYSQGDTERIAFTSTRSGKLQIWLKENNQLQQLTHFKDKAYIYELKFSANGENLLFLRDDKLYVLNILSKEIKAVSHPNEIVKNIAWLCQSNDSILTTVLEDGSWHLYQINIHTHASKHLTAGITSIHNQCGNDGNNRYFASVAANKGIYQLTPEWKVDKAYHYFPDINFDYNLDWAVGNDAIYRITAKREIFKLDFATGQKLKVNIGDTNTMFITIHHNNLLMNNFKMANTYIGKITIPDLDRRINH